MTNPNLTERVTYNKMRIIQFQYKTICETAIENLWHSFQQINCHLTFYAPKFLISGLCIELGNLAIPEFLPSARTTRS